MYIEYHVHRDNTGIHFRFMVVWRTRRAVIKLRTVGVQLRRAIVRVALTNRVVRHFCQSHIRIRLLTMTRLFTSVSNSLSRETGPRHGI